MRKLSEQERIRLATFIGTEEWKLSTEIMEEALAELLDAVKLMPPTATADQVSAALRGYQFAAAHYAKYIELLNREVGAVGKTLPDILPDITEDVMNPKQKVN